MTVVIIHRARKDYPCGRQLYWDRMSTDEKREYYDASECSFGGMIHKGEHYAETEGQDPFHPCRTHIDCERFNHD